MHTKPLSVFILVTRWQVYIHGSMSAGYTFVDADLGGGAFARVFLVRNEATQDLQAMKRNSSKSKLFLVVIVRLGAGWQQISERA